MKSNEREIKGAVLSNVTVEQGAVAGAAAFVVVLSASAAAINAEPRAWASVLSETSVWMMALGGSGLIGLSAALFPWAENGLFSDAEKILSVKRCQSGLHQCDHDLVDPWLPPSDLLNSVELARCARD